MGIERANHGPADRSHGRGVAGRGADAALAAPGRARDRAGRGRGRADRSRHAGAGGRRLGVARLPLHLGAQHGRRVLRLRRSARARHETCPTYAAGTRVRLSTSAGEEVAGVLTGDPMLDPPTGQEAVDGLAADLGMSRAARRLRRPDRRPAPHRCHCRPAAGRTPSSSSRTVGSSRYASNGEIHDRPDLRLRWPRPPDPVRAAACRGAGPRPGAWDVRVDRPVRAARRTPTGARSSRAR